MKSKISCFNLSVLRKDITRYVPVWLSYSIFLAMCVILLTRGSTPAFTAEMIPGALCFMAVVNLIYGVVCASSLFGDLFSSRMCNALHALPMRRDGWFLTHCSAGLLFSLLPSLLAALLSYPMLKEYYYLAWIWLGGTSLQFLFFFGLSVFCVFCTGNRLGLVCMYGLLNFLALLISGIIQTLYMPLLWGLTMTFDPVLELTPVASMAGSSYMRISKIRNTAQAAVRFEGFVQGDWNYLFILAAAGVLLAGLGLILYRHRNLERAGDFLAFRGLEPVFLLISSLGCGLFFYLFTDIFTNMPNFFFLTLGMAVGYFASKMLLSRSVRVFTLRPLLGFGVTVLIVAGSMGLTYLDPMGLVSRVPDTDEVLEASISSVRFSPQNYQSGEEQIRAIRSLHESLIRSRRPAGEEDYRDVPVTIHYRLKNGTTLSRVYEVRADTSAGQAFRDYMSRPEQVFSSDPAQFRKRIQSAAISMWDRDVWQLNLPEAYWDDIMDAIVKDCHKGTMAQPYQFHPDFVGQIDFVLRTPGGPQTYTVSFPAEAVSTCETVSHLAALTSSRFPDTRQ